MNRGRPRHDDILTPREWQVLELIEAGLTNEEIASRLGISFGTAKYHVAEIISKLGVSSRDEAPEAARGRQTAAPGMLALAWMRARFVLPAFGVVIAGLLLLATLALFTDLFRMGASVSPSEEDLARAAVDFQDADATTGGAGSLGPTQTLTSYYFEARLDSDQDDVLDTVRAWYRSPDHWRFEFGDFSEGIPTRGSVQVSNGETVLFYDAKTNTYYRQDVDEYFSDWPPEMREAPLFLPTSMFVGPLPGSTEGFFNALTGQWRLEEHGDGAVIAGRPTEFWRFDVPEAGSTTFWLDREHAFVLRFEAEDSGPSNGRLITEVVEVALNGSVEDQRFRFELPENALEVEAPPGSVSHSMGSGSSGIGSEFDPPEGFFSPSYLPEGYAVTSTEMSSSPTNAIHVASYVVRLEAGDGTGYIEVEQRYRAGGLPPSDRQGTAIDIGGSEAYQRLEDGMAVMALSAGDIVVVLRANQLPPEELVRIATSMQP